MSSTRKIPRFSEENVAKSRVASRMWSQRVIDQKPPSSGRLRWGLQCTGSCSRTRSESA